MRHRQRSLRLEKLGGGEGVNILDVGGQALSGFAQAPFQCLSVGFLLLVVLKFPENRPQSTELFLQGCRVTGPLVILFLCFEAPGGFFLINELLGQGLSLSVYPAAFLD